MSVIAPSTLASAGAPSRLTNPAIPHIYQGDLPRPPSGMAAFSHSRVPEQGWPGKSSTLLGRNDVAFGPAMKHDMQHQTTEVHDY